MIIVNIGSDNERGRIEAVLLRVAALVTGVGTIAFLSIGGGWRTSNLFLVPDLLVSGVLAGGALASARTMPAVLLTGFAMGVGVFSAATASYLIQGVFGIGATTALVTCVVAGGWLLRSFLIKTTR